MNRTVRAKLHCHHKETQGEYTQIFFHAAYSGKENEEFFKTTPGANLSMTIRNPEAAAFFESGKEYFVDFSPEVVAETPAETPAETTAAKPQECNGCGGTGANEQGGKCQTCAGTGVAPVA